jgi:hypothetical protein
MQLMGIAFAPPIYAVRGIVQNELSNIEHSDDRIRKARELGERRSDWPMFEVSGFVDAYLHGQFNLGLRCALGEYTNYGFVISTAHPASGNRRKVLLSPQPMTLKVPGCISAAKRR